MAKLQGIMFCEFDIKVGPRIAYQSPKDFITKEQMDSIAPYIITKPQFENRLISLKALGFRFMGFCVRITNKEYKRNALMFNVCFIFAEDASIQEYEPVVKKLAGYLTILERETGFVCREETRAKIPDMLDKVMHDLNSDGECAISINEGNTIFLKVVQRPKQQPTVLDHHVPVFLWSKDTIQASHWDLTANQVLPYIDGFNHVQKIASLSDVDLSLVRSAIQTLQFHGVVTLVPIFLYSNMYALKPEINLLYRDLKMQKECISYVAKDQERMPNFRDVFELYCALGPGITVRHLCNRHDPSSAGIDEQKFIQYGLIKGFITKLDKYPVLLTSEPPSTKLKTLSKWLNGYYSYEEICCRSMAAGDPIPYDEIDKKTESDPYVVHIWK